MTTTHSRLGFALDKQAKTPGVWAALLAGAALGWTVTVRVPWEMGNAPGTMGRGLAGFMFLWIAMMAAMMLPSVAPVGSLYLRSVRSRSTGALRAVRVVAVVLGYLGVWATFGIAAFGVAWAGGWLATEAPSAASWAGAAVLAGAGLYQLTPLKDRCLSHCRSPLGFLLDFGGYSRRSRRARRPLPRRLLRRLLLGALRRLDRRRRDEPRVDGRTRDRHLPEKTWRFGKALGIAFGIALLVVALFVPSHPELVPGLHVDGGTGTTPMEP